MSKMKATEKQAMEILKKLDELIDNSVDLDAEIESSEGIEEILCVLEETIDEFCDAIELIEDIRCFLMELNEMDDDDPEEDEEDDCDCCTYCAPPELRAELIRIAEMAMAYEHMAAEKRAKSRSGVSISKARSQDHPESAGPRSKCQTHRKSTDQRLAGMFCSQAKDAEPDITFPEEDSVAMLFYDSEDYRVFPFEHVLRICPWLNDHSVMRAIPMLKDLYYLFEEGTEVSMESGKYLVGPVVVIKLNDAHFLVTPNAMDRRRVRKFMEDHTETADFENGAAYAALRYV